MAEPTDAEWQVWTIEQWLNAITGRGYSVYSPEFIHFWIRETYGYLP